MKKIKYIITAAIACIMAASCSLNEVSFTEVEKDKFMKDADQAETVLLGVYRNMMKDGLYAYHLSLYFTLPTDQAKVEGNSVNNFRNVPCNHYTSSEDEVEQTWRDLYNAVYDANDFIERLSANVENYTELDKKRAAVYMGEARTLRALYYFELVRWYGNIALMTTTEQSHQHPSTFVQADPVDVYKFIEADLKYAIDVLPYATDDAVRKGNQFRISKGAALGLLTKVYATWAGYPLKDESKWAEAANTAKVLVESGKHDLLEDYTQLWKNSANNVWDPKESLLEVSFFSPTITGQSANDPSGRIGKWNGVAAGEGSVPIVRVAANWQIVPTFLWKWKDYEKDARFAVSYADYKYTKDGVQPIYKEGNFLDAMPADAKGDARRAFNSALTPGKWDIMKYASKDNQLIDANFSNVNWYLIRYADVLLLYAEALNESLGAPDAAAYAAINKVRKRAGLDELSGLSTEQFRQAVRDERSHELAFEGHRRQDLTRWGIYAKTIQETYSGLAEWHEDAPEKYPAGIYTVEGKHELLPIPLRDKDLMPQFVQNPGW